MMMVVMVWADTHLSLSVWHAGCYLNKTKGYLWILPGQVKDGNLICLVKQCAWMLFCWVIMVMYALNEGCLLKT